jgi:DNA-binding LytR/AlgR family response regulator
MNLTCIIVEDLVVAAEYLKKCCEKIGGLEVLGSFPNAEEALVFLNQHPVDLIFLDVEMPGSTGFELLDQLPFSPKVILTTSKTEYAYNAFEYNVNDFLKKPFTYQRFQEAVRKVESQVEASREGAENTEETDHIYIKSDGKLIRLNNEDILYIESMGDYVKFVTAEKKFITHNTIKNLEEKVNRQTFMKVHRSYIINTSKIDNIRENYLFISGKEIPVSKAHKQDVMNKLNII